MNSNRAEELMWEVRQYLYMASQFELAGQIDLADRCGEIATKQMTASVRLSTPIKELRHGILKVVK